jgi:hypothetical protein
VLEFSKEQFPLTKIGFKAEFFKQAEEKLAQYSKYMALQEQFLYYLLGCMHLIRTRVDTLLSK